MISEVVDNTSGTTMFDENQFPLSHCEAEHLVTTIKLGPSAWGLEEIGSSRWLENHAVLERLNKEAHAQAVDGTDEFVKDIFVREDRIKDLIGELILIWTWKSRVYPLISSKLSKLSSLRNYVPLYHEATVVNLIEVSLPSMSHADGVEAAGDTTVDLVDYCASKLASLLQLHTKLAEQSKKLSLESPDDRRQRLISQSDEDVLESQYDEIEFQVCMCALSIVRFLCEHRAHCPLTLTTRLLETHDLLMTLVPLLEAAPWIRKTPTGQLEKFEEHQWRPLHGGSGPVRMPKAQGQVWLSIYQLLMDPVCRQQYSLQSQCRVDNLLRYLNEAVFEELPFLSVLLRALEELAISGQMVAGVGDNSSGPFGGLSMSSGAANAFSVELVAEIIESLKTKYRGKWKETAERQLAAMVAADKNDGPEDLKKLSKMVSIPDEWRLAIEENSGDLQTPKCPQCGKDADQRCTRCKREFYCSRECQVAHWRVHRERCQEAPISEATCAGS
ncbi:Zinc finger MYND domain-containing protein 10 [Perkinsus chesapeaki]|uniref:Zinc finger MYND domain-containing protein 10 n=1 Tax=Perkinsus chesapeaki TaxID=330153 RepID=A0A7J6MYJ9_PERCH|nr:Zinc finger MYND domain-containing protein 10 [Perkinsus chesapeaki]